MVQQAEAEQTRPDSEPLRIAQVMGIMNSGGVEAVVMNYYRAIDKTKAQFDFFVDETCSFPQREEIERLGGRYYLVPPYCHVFSYIRTLKRLFKQNGYRIVHAHNNTINVFPLCAAYLAGVPIRICHNHSTANWGEGLKTLLKYVLRPFAKVFATDYFACGEKAGRWMYGDKCYNAGKVHVMPNAIDTEKFAFDPQARKRLRSELGIGGDTLVVGHVGRFTYAKNHAFLIDVFATLHKEKPDSRLLLVGEGELEDEVRAKVSALGLDVSVLFLGVRRDVDKLYSAMDVFCLPSFYEGMPVVLVEAQANGLPCVVSDRVQLNSACSDELCAIANYSSSIYRDKLFEMHRKEDNIVCEKIPVNDIGFQAKEHIDYYIGLIEYIRISERVKHGSV